MAENIKPKKSSETKHGGDILIVRIIVCVVVLLGALFVRFNNQYIYDSLKCWYQENVLEERYSFEHVGESIKNSCSPLKTKLLDLFLKSNSADK